MQGDGYRLTDAHTLRAGFYFSGERGHIDNTEAVFPADDMGNQTSTTPFDIVDNTSITAWLYSVYLQDEWRPIQPLTVNFGIRYDLTDAFVHADQFSPRVGALYEFPTHTTLHAAYARYFTPPPTELVSTTDVQKFDNTTGALSSEGTFKVKPESSHYFDVGASSSSASRSTSASTATSSTRTTSSTKGSSAARWSFRPSITGAAASTAPK